MNFKQDKALCYPLFVALFPVMFWYSENAREAFLVDVLGTGAIVLGVTIAVTLVLRLFIKDPIKVAALVIVLLVVFFSYGLARNVLLFRLDLAFGAEPYLSRILVALAIFFSAVIVLWRWDLSLFVHVVTVASLALLAFNVIRVVSVSFGSPEDLLIDGTPPEEVKFAPADTEHLPDFYYIVVDGYSRADFIKENYYYDNVGFIESLTEKGFYVVEEASGNYSHTWMSTASTLSMKYLVESDDEFSLVEEIPVVRALKNLDYKYVHVQSGRGVSKRNRNADIELYDKSGRKIFVNEFSRAMFDWTLAAPVAGDVGVRIDDLFVQNKATSFRKSIGWLDSIPNIPDPTFAFSHVYPMHTPFIFLSDGSIRSDATVPPGIELGRELYVEALIYTNRTLETLVDNILDRSENAPVIIIQGDHSAWGLPWSLHIEEEDILERTAIFNAIYVPEYCRTGFYPNMTPVNTFRLILNNCLGSNL